MSSLPVNPQLSKLPPYLFVELDRKRILAAAAGADIINLGIGDPDLPTPDFIIDKMASAIRNPSHHRYPDGKGSPEFRQSAAKFMKRHYGVTLNPETEIIALIGSKEGIGHLPIALAGAGDSVLIPDPGYPPYLSGTLFANAKPVIFPLRERNAFLPDFKDLPGGARLLFLNYPNNPTGATAPRGFFKDAVKWALAQGTWLAHDAAYAEAFFDGMRPESLLQAPGAMDCGLEFHSLSKTFNMTGWRVGWACGNADAIAALAKVKNNVDSGVFTAIQDAACAALDHGDAAAEAMRSSQKARRQLCVSSLKKAGWKVLESSATFYLWCAVPKGYTSAACAEKLLTDAAIVSTPGNGFGPAGEGYLRLALTVSDDRLKLAMDRIAALRW